MNLMSFSCSLVYLGRLFFPQAIWMIWLQVSWKKPIPGWVKLNTDESVIEILRRLGEVGCCAIVMGTGSLVL